MVLERIVVQLRSGFFVGSTKKFKEQILEDRDSAILNATKELLNEVLPTVAKRSGKLRTSLELMLLNQINFLQGKRVIRLAFKRLKTPDYSTYHVFGFHGSAISRRPYKHRPSYLRYSPRTVTGTKPIDEREVIRLWRRLITKHLAIELRKSGFQFTQVLRVR